MASVYIVNIIIVALSYNWYCTSFLDTYQNIRHRQKLHQQMLQCIVRSSMVIPSREEGMWEREYYIIDNLQELEIKCV